MFKSVILLLALLFSGTAQAQTWYSTPNTHPQPPDTSLLPLSVTFDYWAPTGWTTPTNVTWDAIWSRNASGAWYRPLGYTQPSIRKNPVYPYPYTCVTLGASGFKCRDLIRGIDRTIACPATISIGSMIRWRSHYNPSWTEYGLYTSNVGPFSCHSGRVLNLQGASVTASGKQINCNYGHTTLQGVGLTHDMWCWRR